MQALDVACSVVNDGLHTTQDIKADFSDRVVVVTGSNTGDGSEAAVKFVQLGADKAILAVRSSPKGEAARKLIEERIGRDGVVEVWLLDMMDYGSLRAFGQRVNEELDHMDIAVLDAACVAANLEPSRYGWDRTLQVNTLSTVVLSLYYQVIGSWSTHRHLRCDIGRGEYWTGRTEQQALFHHEEVSLAK